MAWVINSHSSSSPSQEPLFLDQNSPEHSSSSPCTSEIIADDLVPLQTYYVQSKGNNISFFLPKTSGTALFGLLFGISPDDSTVRCTVPTILEWTHCLSLPTVYQYQSQSACETSLHQQA